MKEPRSWDEIYDMAYPHHYVPSHSDKFLLQEILERIEEDKSKKKEEKENE